MPEEEKNTPTPAPAESKVRQRMRGRYKDVNPQTDAEWDDIYERGFAEDEEKLKIFEDNSKVLDDLVNSDKDLYAIVSYMLVDHIPVRAAVAKVFGPDNLEPKEGDPDYEYWQQSADERRKRGEDYRKWMAEKKKNEEEANKNIDEFCAEKGYDDAEKQNLINFINDFYDSLSSLKISKDLLQKFDDARNHDKDVETAAAEGKINGRNENIVARRAEENGSRSGDGIPTPTGGGAAPMEPARKPEATELDDILEMHRR